MERRAARTQDPQRLTVARAILQRGLQINPGSGCLAQAWGLMELQKGNAWAAVRLVSGSTMTHQRIEYVSVSYMPCYTSDVACPRQGAVLLGSAFALPIKAGQEGRVKREVSYCT